VRLEVDVFKGHDKVESMNMGYCSSNCPQSHPDLGGSRTSSMNPNSMVGTSSGIGQLDASSGDEPNIRVRRQLSYIPGLQSQLQRSPLRSIQTSLFTMSKSLRISEHCGIPIIFERGIFLSLKYIHQVEDLAMRLQFINSFGRGAVS
jgi:hypothetical protein